MSLMERDKNEAGLYIASVFDKEQDRIWTADRVAEGTALDAWAVYFDLGFYYNAPVPNITFVRAVR